MARLLSLLLLSTCVHALLLSPAMRLAAPLNGAASPSRLSVHLLGKSPLSGRARVMEIGGEAHRKPVPEGIIAATPSNLPNSPWMSDAKKRIYAPDELDTQPELIGEMLLDTEVALANELSGRAELSILIDENGLVPWVIVESSDFDEAMNNRFVEKFKSAQFSAPQVAKQLVSAIIRIQVEVASALP